MRWIAFDFCVLLVSSPLRSEKPGRPRGGAGGRARVSALWRALIAPSWGFDARLSRWRVRDEDPTTTPGLSFRRALGNEESTAKLAASFQRTLGMKELAAVPGLPFRRLVAMRSPLQARILVPPKSVGDEGPATAFGLSFRLRVLAMRDLLQHLGFHSGARGDSTLRACPVRS